MEASENVKKRAEEMQRAVARKVGFAPTVGHVVVVPVVKVDRAKLDMPGIKAIVAEVRAHSCYTHHIYTATHNNNTAYSY